LFASSLNCDMRVFITGATGFIGGALARELVKQGSEVHALVRPSADSSTLKQLRVTCHVGDVTDPASLDGFGGTDWIVHAAGRLGEPGVSEAEYHRVHADGTRNLLAAVQAIPRPPRVLYVSSPGVLGPVHGAPATEDAPRRPSNPYERSKSAGEVIAHEFVAQGLPVVLVRPEFVYGPGDRHVLKLFQAIQRGRFLYVDGGRHYCHPTFIDDAVAGMLLCMARGRPGEIYHVTGPRSVKFRELAEAISAALGVPPPKLSLPRWSVMAAAVASEAIAPMIARVPPISRTAVAFFSEDRSFSWKKTHDELDYVPKRDIAVGTTETVDWYRRHGWL
jgi:nucleoside-diphosphate-sugar epimerase